MFRKLLVLTGVALAAAPATAGTYSAKPAAPVSENRIIERNIVWACGPAACVGSTENSRPLVLCQGLAKKAGRIESFIVNGRAIAKAELDRCNAFARESSDPALANARWRRAKGAARRLTH
ncbi:MAG: CC_3452 family protein [Sphingomicrobium sp.]